MRTTVDDRPRLIARADRPDSVSITHPGRALAVAVLGFFVVTLDALVVNVALPAIGRDLGRGITGLQWVVDGYTLMFAALLLLATAAASLSLRPARQAHLPEIPDGPPHAHEQETGDTPMTAWTNDELTMIGAADELELASLRRDGTLRKAVTIWVVRHGDDLYVRSWRGRTAAWFRGTQVRHEGRIWAGGIEKDVTFVEETDPGINDQIDAMYHTKYRSYGARYVDPMVAPEARAATIKLVPRATT